MLPGRPYLMKIGARTVTASITSPRHKVNVNTLEHLAAKQLELNEIGVCNVAMDRPVPFDPYASNRDTGGFILIDRMSNHTVGAGMLHFALRRSHNIHVQPVDVNKAARAAQKHQRPAVLWFTGLSGAGKSFCVGQDLKEHVSLLQAADPAPLKTVEEHYNPLVRAVATMPKPVIMATQA